jgi:hypothetical protein
VVTTGPVRDFTHLPGAGPESGKAGGPIGHIAGRWWSPARSRSSSVRPPDHARPHPGQDTGQTLAPTLSTFAQLRARFDNTSARAMVFTGLCDKMPLEEVPEQKGRAPQMALARHCELTELFTVVRGPAFLVESHTS